MLCTFLYGRLPRRTCPNIYGIEAFFYSTRRLFPKRTPQSGWGPFDCICVLCVLRASRDNHLAHKILRFGIFIITMREYSSWKCRNDILKYSNVKYQRLRCYYHVFLWIVINTFHFDKMNDDCHKNILKIFNIANIQ